MNGDEAAFADLCERFERRYLAAHPVDASFIDGSHDAALPDPARDAGGVRIELDAFESELAATRIPERSGARLDARHLRARIAEERLLLERPPSENPTWYTGELAFGIVSLLLPSAIERDANALATRLAAAPAFLDAGVERLRHRDVPTDWCERARREAGALERLLDALEAHAIDRRGLRVPSAASFEAVRRALFRLVAALALTYDRTPACGVDRFERIVRDVHGLDGDATTLERAASAAFDEALADVEERAARLDRTRTWREQIERLGARGPEPARVLASYRDADARARTLGDELVPVADAYALAYEPLPAWAAAIASDLYFLFYRSPSPRAPGRGSTYFVGALSDDAAAVARAHNFAAIKEVHAVHHGSVGHHTQNFFARAADSRFARFAGNDCASAIAWSSAGTMVEGWATYVEDVMDEIPEFYSDAERLQLAHSRSRLAATALGDLRLHCGTWTLAEMRRFYREDAAFAPGRVWSETTRNAIFPGSRIMYWAGNRAIRGLRRRATVPAREFHRALLAHGHVAVAWAGDELVRAGVVR